MFLGIFYILGKCSLLIYKNAPRGCAKVYSLVFLDRNCYDIIKRRMTTIQNGGRNHA